MSRIDPLVSRAFAEAAKYGDSFVGTHHLVLALLVESSIVTDVLVEHGITYDEVIRLTGWSSDPGAGPSGPNPDATYVCGRAQGLALAAGRAQPLADDWIVGMLYSADGSGFAWVLQHFAVSRPDLANALRRRNVVIPDVPLPPYAIPTVTRA